MTVPIVPQADVVNVKRHRKEQVQQVLGYTNTENPFNDPALTDKFVWRKRSEFLHAAGLYDKTDKRMQLEKIDGKMAEIERVKSRRDERVIEQQMLEEQRSKRERELQAETFGDWESQQEIFHLEQIRNKSAIRIEQGRERPVDLMYKAMQIIDCRKFDDMELMATPPHLYIQQMHKDDLIDLRKDVRDFASAEICHACDWLGMLCDDALEVIARKESGLAEECAIPANIAEDVHDMLSGQTAHELTETKWEVEESLNSQDCDAVDTTFMEAVRKRIPFYIAMREVIEFHEKAIKIAYGPSGVPKKRPTAVEDENTEAIDVHPAEQSVPIVAAEESEAEIDEETLLMWEPALQPVEAVEKKRGCRHSGRCDGRANAKENTRTAGRFVWCATRRRLCDVEERAYARLCRRRGEFQCSCRAGHSGSKEIRLGSEVQAPKAPVFQSRQNGLFLEQV